MLGHLPSGFWAKNRVMKLKAFNRHDVEPVLSRTHTQQNVRRRGKPRFPLLAAVPGWKASQRGLFPSVRQWASIQRYTPYHNQPRNESLSAAQVRLHINLNTSLLLHSNLHSNASRSTQPKKSEKEPPSSFSIQSPMHMRCFRLDASTKC